MADRLIVTTDLLDLTDLPPCERRRRTVWHDEFASERILVAEARELRVEVDKLLVLALDTARCLGEKLGEPADRLLCAYPPTRTTSPARG